MLRLNACHQAVSAAADKNWCKQQSPPMHTRAHTSHSTHYLGGRRTPLGLNGRCAETLLLFWNLISSWLRLTSTTQTCSWSPSTQKLCGHLMELFWSDIGRTQWWWACVSLQAFPEKLWLLVSHKVKSRTAIDRERERERAIQLKSFKGKFH